MININVDIKDIKNIPLFASLNHRQLNKLSPLLGYNDYDTGEIVFLQGDNSNQIYIILSGEVQIIKESTEGKEKVLKILHRGDFFGEMGVIENKIRSATAVASKNSKIMVLEKETFLSYIKNNPAVAFKIILELSSRLRTANSEIEHLAFLKVEDRLKKLLTRFADEKDGQLVVNKNLTHKEMAKMIGTSRETVTRMLNRLIDKKLISIDDNKIYLNF